MEELNLFNIITAEEGVKIYMFIEFFVNVFPYVLKFLNFKIIDKTELVETKSLVNLHLTINVKGNDNTVNVNTKTKKRNKRKRKKKKK